MLKTLHEKLKIEQHEPYNTNPTTRTLQWPEMHHFALHAWSAINDLSMWCPFEKKNIFVVYIWIIYLLVCTLKNLYNFQPTVDLSIYTQRKKLSTPWYIKS